LPTVGGCCAGEPKNGLTGEAEEGPLIEGANRAVFVYRDRKNGDDFCRAEKRRRVTHEELQNGGAVPRAGGGGQSRPDRELDKPIRFGGHLLKFVGRAKPGRKKLRRNPAMSLAFHIDSSRQEG